MFRKLIHSQEPILSPSEVRRRKRPEKPENKANTGGEIPTINTVLCIALLMVECAALGLRTILPLILYRLSVVDLLRLQADVDVTVLGGERSVRLTGDW